jgi:hypothetical protein
MSATKDIQTEANRHYASQFDGRMRYLISAAENYEAPDHDEALEELQELPLAFEKVITNHRRETIEYEILLGTGGPADRVYVITDFNGAIESAEYQFQDWFQPWTTAEGQDSELVERFAAIVGFYEEG